MYEDAGKIISEIRRRALMNQTQFADYIGVSRQTISSWESGYTVPDAPQLSNIHYLASKLDGERLMEAYRMPAANNNGNYDNLAFDAMIVP